VFGLGLLGRMIYVIDYGCSWVEVAEWNLWCCWSFGWIDRMGLPLWDFCINRLEFDIWGFSYNFCSGFFIAKFEGVLGLIFCFG